VIAVFQVEDLHDQLVRMLDALSGKLNHSAHDF
jgi:hypothetical protein